MARYRLSEPAEADIVAILRRSEEIHGRQARICYRACLTAAMRRVAADPVGRSTVDRAELIPGVRSFHIRHSRGESRETLVANPVHVLFYRATQSGTIERSSVCCTIEWRHDCISAARIGSIPRIQANNA